MWIAWLILFKLVPHDHLHVVEARHTPVIDSTTHLLPLWESSTQNGNSVQRWNISTITSSTSIVYSPANLQILIRSTTLDGYFWHLRSVQFSFRRSQSSCTPIENHFSFVDTESTIKCKGRVPHLPSSFLSLSPSIEATYSIARSIGWELARVWRDYSCPHVSLPLKTPRQYKLNRRWQIWPILSHSLRQRCRQWLTNSETTSR